MPLLGLLSSCNAKELEVDSSLVCLRTRPPCSAVPRRPRARAGGHVRANARAGVQLIPTPDTRTSHLTKMLAAVAQPFSSADFNRRRELGTGLRATRTIAKAVRIDTGIARTQFDQTLFERGDMVRDYDIRYGYVVGAHLERLRGSSSLTLNGALNGTSTLVSVYNGTIEENFADWY